jgi:hypothetical protein
MPRFSISSLMALVMLVAVEIWAIKTLLVPPMVGPPYLSDLILFGTLPMANVLALGSLPFWTRAGRARERPILLGFEVFGVVAMVLFFVASLMAGHTIHDWVGDALRHLPSRPGDTLFLTLAVVILLLPQLGLATLGAWLSSGYKVRVKVVVERRNFASPEETGATDSPIRAGGLEVG